MRICLLLTLFLFLSCGDDKIVHQKKCPKDADIETVCGQQRENFCVLWAFLFQAPCFQFSDANDSCFQCVQPECIGCLMIWQGNWTNKPLCEWEWARPTTDLQCRNTVTGELFIWHAGVKLYNYAYQYPL